MRGLAWHSTAIAMAVSSGCTLKSDGKIPDPQFKKYSRQHTLAVRAATHRIGDLELTVVSASVTEVYTVMGSVDFTAYILVRLANTGSRQLLFDMKDMEAIQSGSGSRTAVYFHHVDLQPHGQGEVKLAVPAGLSRLDKPLALVYKGVRMDLN